MKERAFLKNLKGTKDYLPEEQQLRQKIEKTLEGVFQRYGVKPMETPILCFYNLLSSKYAGGEEIVKEMYTLKDNGGRELALRYDLTVPFAKVVGMNPYQRFPLKRYEVGKVFRDSPVKTGRLREFVQCDVDIVGVKGVCAEAELVAMAANVFRELELDVVIHYNSRKLLAGVLKNVGIKENMLNRALLTLDKLEKYGEGSVKAELEDNGIPKSVVDKVFDALSLDSLTSFAEYFPDDLVKKGVEELKEFEDYLQVMGVKNYTRFNSSLARGLDIYTGIVYEVFLNKSEITSSVASGGRYDDIIGSFLESENKYPATGISFGLDVIYTALSLEGRKGKTENNTIFIVPLGAIKKAVKIAEKLRNTGISVEVEMTGRKLKKALDYANKEGYPLVIILGEQEISEGKASCRDMHKGEESLIPLAELEERLKFLAKSF